MSNVILSLDYETYYEKKTYSVTELGNWRYLHDERFDPYMISVSDGKDTWAGEPKDFNWDCLNDVTLLSHNAAFDSMVYRTMVEKGMAPDVKFRDWLCTANLTSFLCNRRALAPASEFLLGEVISKAARSDADGKHWRDIQAEGKGEAMLNYARGDALRCHQIYSRYGHFWTPFERRLSALTIKQANRGVQIDVAKLEEYYKTVHTALHEMQQSLPWVKEGKKVLSGPAVYEECRRSKIPGPPVKSHEGGEEAFAEWYKTYGPKFTWIRTFSDVRSIGILLDTLEKIRTRIDENGILTFGMLYFGSHTGRWSGSGGINLLNLRKAPYFFGDDGLPRAEESECNEIERCFTETGKYPDWVRHIVDIRSLIVARPGRKLIISDLSQIEPRVLAWMCGDTEMLRRMAAGASPYQAHAETTMGWTLGDMKKLIKGGNHEAKKLYALAKARVLGLGYQCAWEKFITVAQTMAGLDVTVDDPEFTQDTDRFTGSLLFSDEEGLVPKMVSGYGFNAKRIVREFRAANPLIVGLWKTFDDAYKSSCGRDFEVTLASGRKMTYRDVKQEWSRVFDEDLKKYRNKCVVKAEVVKSGRIQRAPLYGGLLVENAVQATARDIFGEHCLTLDATAGVDVLFGVHDETVNECDLDVQPRDIEHIMGQTPEWISGCPVAAEAKESACYLK